MTGWKPKQAIHLETARFRLVSLTRRQAARQSLPWTEDPEFMAGLELRAGGWLLRRWRRRFQRFDNKRNICLGMVEKDSGAVVGYHTIQISGDIAFIGVLVGDKSWWGKGAVAETRAEILRFLFQDARVHRVWGTPFGRNLSSIYNYQRLGFVYEGNLRQQGRSLQDGHVDLLIFGLLRDEWQARQDKVQQDKTRQDKDE